MGKKVILAYSGGLDTTCILFWLKEQGYDVVCYLADIGQQEDFQLVESRALELGAIKAVIDNRQQEFVEQFILPAMGFGTVYQHKYLLGTSLARPVIAKGLIETAAAEGTNLIAHGATGKGNDQVRFELSCASLQPKIQVIAPWRLPQFYERFQGRQDLLDYAAANGFPVTATKAKPYSVDENLMHISFESGMLEDPMNAPHEDMFKMTVAPSLCPKEPIDLTLTFVEAKPVMLEVHNSDTSYTSPLEIVKVLNDLAGKQGVGRIDIVEDRYIGMKSRGCYETPGSTVIFEAARDLEVLCLDREVNKVRQQLAVQFSEKVYNGLWFSPEGQYLKTCLELSQRNVNGKVRVRLYAGNVIITGRKAENSLYNQELVSMDVQGEFTPIHAEGFIRTQAIRLNAFRYVYDKNPYTLKKWED